MTFQPIRGLHHVTAIAGDPQRNLDFYTLVLGQRFVKRTVNFDDPGTYHFYFGDDAGSPGTIMTSFPWPHASRGVVGAGEVTHIAYSVPTGSMDYWAQRLTAHGVAFTRTAQRMGSTVLTFDDPDGMKIELVGQDKLGDLKAPRFSDVPVGHAIRGFFGVTMLQRDATRTEPVLALMGYQKVAEEGNRIRFSASGEALGRYLDIVVDPAAPKGRMGAGSVHHIAFRLPDDAAQLAWQEELRKYVSVTPVMDRDYFHSIYFNEPGGVIFEMATDAPGFATDEPLESLGEALRIPAWLEPRRKELELRLPAITLHKASTEVVS